MKFKVSEFLKVLLGENTLSQALRLEMVLYLQVEYP